MVDPLAAKYYSLSPYTYVANNPLTFIDPDGKKIIGKNGKTVTYENGKIKNATGEQKRIFKAMVKTKTGEKHFNNLINHESEIEIKTSTEIKYNNEGKYRASKCDN